MGEKIMENTLIDRVKILIVKLQVGSVRAFALNIGIKQATFDKKIRGEQKLSIEIVDAILRTYPEVSAEWLMRGNGKMFLDEEGNSKDNDEKINFYKSEYENIKQRLEKELELMKDMSNELDSKRARIEFLLQERNSKN